MQGQSVEHCSVAGLQHWLARQSEFDLQQATHVLPWQHWPAPQSESEQQALDEMHVSLQHCSPEPHCAFVVQGQSDEHCSVVGLQHWLARQSVLARHPATHVLFLQTGVPPSLSQSPLPQQLPRTQTDPQHFEPVPHCASTVQGQFEDEHSFVAVSQH